MSSRLYSRISRPSLHSKIATAEDCIPFFKNGQSLGWSGFTPAGYPKAVPIALAEYVERNKLQGKLRFSLFVGASVGEEVEDRWASNDMIQQRWPYQSGKSITKKINTGEIDMGDIHLSMFAQDIAWGFFTKDSPETKGRLDIGMVEVTEILSDGSLVLGPSVGATPEIIDVAEKLIIEVNTKTPKFKGAHDIAPDEKPPFRKPYLISRVDDRIGSFSVPCDPEKIVAVVESNYQDNGRALRGADDVSEQIAKHLLNFFKKEVNEGRLPENLLPLQSGVGNIANAVISGLANGPFSDVNVWTEVLQDTMLDFFDSGKLNFATTTSLSLSPEGFERFSNRKNEYLKRICLRPQQITNHPEIIKRLGVIGMNTPIEIDIYGHANSTLVGGTKMIHGIGGSGDFLRNAYLSILHAPSARPTKTDPFGISTIVPHCSHIDHTEHDISIVVTEQGLADLRGLAPRQRAKKLIENCAHPEYKPILKEYYRLAEERCMKEGAAHEPQILSAVFQMHENLRTNGTMRLNSWKI